MLVWRVAGWIVHKPWHLYLKTNKSLNVFRFSIDFLSALFQHRAEHCGIVLGTLASYFGGLRPSHELFWMIFFLWCLQSVVAEYHSCFMFRRSQVQIFAWRPAIMADGFVVFLSLVIKFPGEHLYPFVWI
jgi:hypothetical protein